MNAFWTYFWPPLGAGSVVGVIGGAIAYRHRNRLYVVVGTAMFVAIALALLWHGPLGAADKFAITVNHDVRAAIVYNEIPEVNGSLQREPLTRKVVLSGPADDFQRSQLAMIIEEIPGVESATWSGGKGIPLIVEGSAAAFLGFLLGLLVAYLRELRRRYNAEWNW